MSQLTVPASVGQNIARAKSLVKRNEPARAIEALLGALAAFEPQKLVGKARSVAEITIYEAVTELNGHPKIKALIQEVAKSPKAAIAYGPGGEKQLATVLNILLKALTEAEAAKVRAEAEALENRRKTLIDKAEEHMAAKEYPRGKAVLRKLGEEFGSEPDIYAYIGTVLAKADLRDDAVEFLELAVETFPRVPAPYGELVSCYIALREFEKAEKVYMKVLKEFGQHPKTLVNLGKLYISWNRKDKAFEILNKAVRMDPQNEEAAELFAKVDR